MDAWSEAVVRALDAISDGVVHVAALDRKQSSLTLGTGVVLDHYHVLTSGQVAGPDDEITIRFPAGRKFSAVCLGVDPLYFVAVMRVEHRLPVELPRICPEAEIRVGRAVLAVGYAMGYELTASQGIVSASDHTVYRPERFPVDGLVVTDAAIHPGNAGGPLVDLEGRVVGLNGIPWVQGLSLALQFTMAARIANQMIEYGQATHPWLGFSGQPEVVDPTLAQLLDLPADRGVVAQWVNSEGPAARAGIQAMDMIVRVDGKPARHVGQLRKALAVHRVGQRVPFTVLRGGDLLELQFPVEEIPNLRGPN